MDKQNVRQDFIIDLGMNNGDDTDYYLKKGFHVLGVDANPDLCEQVRRRFSQEITQNKLKILNGAISSKIGLESFFVNLTQSHWSSLDLNWASRENSDYQEIKVKTFGIYNVFIQYGVPYYLKIDIEGADMLVLDQLLEVKNKMELPYYISIEDCRFGYEYINKLYAMGYKKFKMLDQSTIPQLKDESVNHQFMQGSSGPLGDLIPFPWLDKQDFELKYSIEVRDHNLNRLAPRTSWWDIHAKKK